MNLGNIEPNVPVEPIVNAPCPKCSSTQSERLGWTWWGGFLAPKLLSLVKCQKCGETYNCNTGKSARRRILLYAAAPFLVVVSATVYRYVQGNSRHSYTFPSGAQYVGDYKGGRPNGQGTYTFPSGTKYVGEFKDGKPNGQGTYTWPGGSMYVGQFKDGQQNGQGTYTCANGTYVGEFRDGKRNGTGRLTLPDGTVEEGLWKDGKFRADLIRDMTQPLPP